MMQSTGYGLRPVVRPVQTLHALTGARFVAALAVLLCHFGPMAGWPVWLTAYGRAAVAFFFVLSGFVLTYNYVDRLPRGDAKAYRDFLQARFARIYPVYFLVLLLGTAAAFWIATRDPAAWPDQSRWHLAASWIANVLMVQSYTADATSIGFWSGPAWSLSCEATFYLAFPMLLRGALRLRGTAGVAWAGLAVWGATVGAVLVAFLIARLGLHAGPQTMDYVIYDAPYLRIGEFATGCLAGLWFVRRGPTPWSHRLSREAAVWASLAVAVFIALAHDYQWVKQLATMSIAFTPACVVLVVALSSGPTLLGRLLSTRVMIPLGEASYSLYLVHWLPMVMLVRLSGDATSTPMALASIVGSVALSLGLYHLVEDPCRRLLSPSRRKTGPRTATVPASAAMPAAASLVSSGAMTANA